MNKLFSVSIAFAFFSIGSTSAQMTFTDYGQYCEVIVESSSPTLIGRIHGVPKSQALATMDGMTDPLAIRLVREVINYAYSRPASMGLETMRSELKTLCMDRKIFIQ